MAKKKQIKKPEQQALLTVVDPDDDDDRDDDEDDDYPDEFCMFKMGDNVAYHIGIGHSVMLYNNTSGALCMAAFKDQGVDMLPIDCEHQTFLVAQNGQPAPAYGWFTPEHREDDGLYAVNVKWTEEGKDLLAKGSNGEPSQYRFFSPAVSLGEDGQVVRLHNCALTNVPALQRLKPLMAASQQGVDMSDDVKKLTEELGQLKAQVEKLGAFRESVLSTLGQKSDESATGALAALVEARTQNENLQKQVTELRAQAKAAEEKEVGQLIAAAVTDGRLPPAKKEAAEILYQKAGRDGLDAFLSALPVLPGQDKTPKAASPDAGLRLLSSADAEVARSMGISPEEMAKTRAAVAARRGRQTRDEE